MSYDEAEQMWRQFSEQSPQVRGFGKRLVGMEGGGGVSSEDMGVSYNGGTQQPWGFPTKNDHFGVEIGGTTVEGNTRLAGKNVLLKQFGMIGIRVNPTPEISFYRV